MGYASNATGTVNDVKRAAAAAHAIGALMFVDAVHFALHGSIDVREIGCDFLACSAYKFFGPHVGCLYVRREANEHVDPLKLRAQEDDRPYRFETGTLNHEGIAGAGRRWSLSPTSAVITRTTRRRRRPPCQPWSPACTHRGLRATAGSTAH